MRGLALLVAILVCSAGAFGQAIAESALTHALSTATSTAVGKALGTATNQVTNRAAGRLGQQTSTPVPRSRIQTVKPGVQKPTGVPPAGTTAEPPSGGSLIASIQGAAPPATCDSAAKDSQSKQPASVQKPAPCTSSADAYQSVINLPAAK
jgi:hypothetical protein